MYSKAGGDARVDFEWGEVGIGIEGYEHELEYSSTEAF